MRKKLVAVFCIIISLISSQYANAAAVTGTKCTKSGLTKTLDSKKYTCIKSGSKLIWNTGVAIEKPAIYLPWATPTSKTQISIESKKKFQEWLLSKGSNSENIGISIDPKIAASKVDYLVKALKLASKTLLTTDSSKPQMYLSVGDEWPISKLKSDYPIHAGFSGKNVCYEPNPFAGCAWVESNLIFFVSANLDVWYSPNQGVLASGAHEFFHLAQGSLMKNDLGLSFHTLATSIPSWFFEGGASFIGTAYADQSGLAIWNNIRNEEIYAYESGRGKNEPLSSFLTNDLDRPSPEGQSHRPYGIGLLACEYIVASVGMENFLDIYRGMGQGLTFSQSFSKATNMELNDFYNKFDFMREKIGFFPVIKG
jgi:hypothetical protein